MTPAPDAIQTARASWGDAAPDWVLTLATECVASSQNKVAKSMGVSASLISQVLRAKYPGDMARIGEIFRGIYMSEIVECPAKGLIPANVCRTWRDRSRTFVSVNSERVTMFRACNQCPRNQQPEGDA
jgi:hypothetical protein